MEKEERQEEEPPKDKPETNNQDIPNARIETVQENIEKHNLKPEQIREYCEKLFKFKTIQVVRFKSWSDRREFSKKKKNAKQWERPTLPDGTDGVPKVF